MEIWNENNIEGVEFEIANSTYKICEIVNHTQRVIRYGTGGQSICRIKEIVKKLNEANHWIPLTQPANEEIIFSLY